jgi:tRNA-specific 2-thiouridylase
MSLLASTLDRMPEASGGARRRVVVAMSGGVDSSVAAALLVHAGHDVVGITLQLDDAARQRSTSARRRPCCAGEDIHDARRVAAALGIPHYVLDYERRFAEAVIAPFASAYAAGETPVPCIACNESIKFGPLLETALQLDAELMATGHYVDRREGPGGPALHRAADPERDQSYFLFATTRAQLSRCVFPIGRLPKADVRALARELALPVAEKPDSQDICFVPDGHYGAVVARLRPDAAEPGEIVDRDGRVLGKHAGIVHYTVGQRRGLGIAAAEPLHVLAIEAETRRIVVGPRAALAVDRLTLRGVNWLGDEAASTAGAGVDICVRVRSSGQVLPARLTHGAAGAGTVSLAAPEHGIARGQACVFYSDAGPQARVLGGGWIAGTERARERTAFPVAGHDNSPGETLSMDGAGTKCGSDAGERGQPSPTTRQMRREVRGVR